MSSLKVVSAVLWHPVCTVVFIQYLVSHSEWSSIKTSRRVKTIVNNSTADRHRHILLLRHSIELNIGYDKYSKILNSSIIFGRNRMVINCSILSEISNVRTILQREIALIHIAVSSGGLSYCLYSAIMYCMF